ncbi:MAG: hypothetical protein ACI9J5_003152, partial [Paraglaciecola sp.]
DAAALLAALTHSLNQSNHLVVYANGPEFLCRLTATSMALGIETKLNLIHSNRCLIGLRLLMFEPV